MGIPEIIAAIAAGTQALAGLVGILGKLHSGQELSESDRDVLKREQAVAEARLLSNLGEGSSNP